MLGLSATTEAIGLGSSYIGEGWKIESTETYIDNVAEQFNIYVEKLFDRNIASSSTPSPKHHEPAKRLYSIWSVENEEHHIDFKKPIFLELEREGEAYLFYHEGIRVLGTGITKYEALQDFQDAFIEIYSSYKETPKEKLTDKAIQLLDYFDSLILEYESIQ